jgi:tetratricopeptide (TPR) repeat protein
LAFAGIFLGVVAFVAHQAVDFGFQNPSLSFAVFCLAGICSVVSPSKAIALTGAKRSGAVLVAVLCLSALTAGGTSRMYIADGRLASLGAIRELLQATMTLVSAGTATGQGEQQQVDYIQAFKLTALVDNSNELKSMGYFAAPSADGPRADGAPVFTRIPIAPTLPPETVFIIEHPEQARLIGRTSAQEWITRATEVDRAYPYRWKLAFDIFQMNEVLLNASRGEAEKKPYVDACLHWAETFLARNPYNGFAHMVMGKALWYRGDWEAAAGAGGGLDSYRAAVGVFADSTEFNPSEPELWRTLAEKAFAFSQMLDAGGMSAEAVGQFALAREAWGKAGELLWLDAKAVSEPERAGMWFAALMAWKNALQRGTEEPMHWHYFGARLDDYAGLLETLGRTKEATAYRAQAEESRERSRLMKSGVVGTP